MPSNVAEDSVDFYEETLNIFKKTPNEGMSDMASILGTASHEKAKKQHRNGIRKVDPNAVSKSQQTHQFRLVDSEEFVIGMES